MLSVIRSTTLLFSWLGTSLFQSVMMPEVPFKPAHYNGGKSTPLRAVLNIALGERIPLGIVLGPSKVLCGEQQDFDFSGLTTEEALQKAVRGTGYQLGTVNGVFNLLAPDLTAHETKVLSHRFDRYPKTSDTMGFTGANLTGWITSSIDGAGGYALSVMSGGDDERLMLTEQSNVTAIDIANAVVKAGSRGVWTLSPSQIVIDDAPRESSSLRIYNFHDRPQSIHAITCLIG